MKTFEYFNELFPNQFPMDVVRAGLVERDTTEYIKYTKEYRAIFWSEERYLHCKNLSLLIRQGKEFPAPVIHNGEVLCGLEILYAHYLEDRPCNIIDVNLIHMMMWAVQ